MSGNITVETSAGRKVRAPLHVWVWGLIDILTPEQLEQLFKRVEEGKVQALKLAMPGPGGLRPPWAGPRR